jgi:phosphate-selective porin OprO/OprP
MLRPMSVYALAAAALVVTAVAKAEEPSASTVDRGRFRIHAGWPEGITYEIGAVTPELEKVGPLAYFEEVYLEGRIGARVDTDLAAFVADESLTDFDDDIQLRRARFYLLGDFRLGLPLAYKFEFSVERTDVFINDFYLRWKPSRWVDSVDFGYLTPPMGLENVVSSRALTLMEIATPVQALAPGYRSGIALAGHWDPWLIAWKGGFYSAGQEQLNGDASDTSAQVVGRVAWLPWRASADTDAPFLHIGLSASYAFSGDSQIRYRARPESFIAPFVVDTGDLPASGAFQYALEGALSRGPLLLSGELLQSYVEGEGGRNNANFGGFYFLTSWMVTGESHPYDTTTGMFTRLVPSHAFSWTQRHWGALEIAERLSWLDLTDGPVRGGEMLTLTSGITWHLNAQFRLFANYVYAHIGSGPQRGDVSLFQARIEIGI